MSKYIKIKQIVNFRPEQMKISDSVKVYDETGSNIGKVIDVKNLSFSLGNSEMIIKLNDSNEAEVVKAELLERMSKDEKSKLGVSIELGYMKYKSVKLIKKLEDENE